MTSREIYRPYCAHHGDVLAGIQRKHDSRASARGPRPGAPWWFCDGRWLLASPEPKRPSQAMCQSIPYRLLVKILQSDVTSPGTGRRAAEAGQILTVAILFQAFGQTRALTTHPMIVPGDLGSRIKVAGSIGAESGST